MYKWVWCGVLATAVVSPGCGSGVSHSEESGFGPSEQGGTPAGGGGGSASSPDGKPSSERPILLPPEGGFGLPDSTQTPESATCAAETRRAKETPLDMVLVMDRSGSMGDKVSGGRKWDLLTAALGSFLRDPASAGIGIGLVFFGIPDGVDDRGDLAVSCRSADYAQPVVPIAPLPGTAPVVVASFQARAPLGGTPTRPALEGASAYAESWLTQHPDHRVAIVLATDGEPNDCDSTIASVSALSVDANQNGIATYVVGVGNRLVDLDQIAAAGGTGKAYVVDTGSDITQSFLSAMNAIRNLAALPCHYSLPKSGDSDAGKRLDFDKVNVAYSTWRGKAAHVEANADAQIPDAQIPDADAQIPDAGGADAGPPRTTTMFEQAPNSAACSANWGEWYYDDARAPTAINLCPATCATVKADLSGEIDVLVGCETVKIPVH